MGVPGGTILNRVKKKSFNQQKGIAMFLRKSLLIFLIGVFSTGAFGAGSHQFNEKVCEGSVQRVLDADTVIFKCNNGQSHRVRVAEIDAPETPKRGERCAGQPIGVKATEFAKKVLLGKSVDLHYFDTDPYGRMVARLNIDGKTSYNRLLVDSGYAHVYKRYAKDPKLPLIEHHAKMDGEGIWGLPEKCQMKPGDWRNRIKNKCAWQKEFKKAGCY